MRQFEFLAIAFAGVAVLNLALIQRRGWRAVGTAGAASICAAAAYLWERDPGALPKWLLAAAGGVFLATVFYESGRQKPDPK